TAARASREREGRQKRALAERQTAIKAVRASWQQRLHRASTSKESRRGQVDISAIIPRVSTSHGCHHPLDTSAQSRPSSHYRSPGSVSPPPISGSKGWSEDPDGATLRVGTSAHTSGKSTSPSCAISPVPPHPRDGSRRGGRSSRGSSAGGAIPGAGVRRHSREVVGAGTGPGAGGGREEKSKVDSEDEGGGVGYFELERLEKEDGEVPSYGVGEGEGEQSQTVPGMRMSFKVYGDVWRWMVDPTVVSLAKRVLEAMFIHVHINSIANQAMKIAQTFPNLSTLRLLDNDIRTLSQLERLGPILKHLKSLFLGDANPLVHLVSPPALGAWVHTQGCRLVLLETQDTSLDEFATLQPCSTAWTTAGDGGGGHRPRGDPLEEAGVVDGAPPPAALGPDMDSLIGQESVGSKEMSKVAVGGGSGASGTGVVDNELRCLKAGICTDDSEVRVRDSFHRLVKVRARAAGSGWGKVALEQVWWQGLGPGPPVVDEEAADQGPDDVPGVGIGMGEGVEKKTGEQGLRGSSAQNVPLSHEGVGPFHCRNSSKWSSSEMIAERLCDGVIRIVSENHRKRENFHTAWEKTIGNIVM
ncbi:unnamed protein product, partial [Choristocarpus tenellus]